MHNLECRDARRLLDAFQDGELDAITSLRVQTHLESCGECARHRLWQNELTRSLDRIRDTTPMAPEALHRHITALSRSGPASFSVWTRPLVRGTAAAVILAFAISLFVLLERGEVENDVRPYVQTHQVWAGEHAQVDLATSDSETAALWFSEQLPGLSAPLSAPPGYALVGTRLAQVGGRPVGVLLYEHEGRSISCFVRLWQEAATEGFDQIALRGEGFLAGRCRGHQIVSWGGEGGSVVLVGDLDEDSLLAFAEHNAVDLPTAGAPQRALSRG